MQALLLVSLLLAPAAFAKPTGNCIFLCDAPMPGGNLQQMPYANYQSAPVYQSVPAYQSAPSYESAPRYGLGYRTGVAPSGRLETLDGHVQPVQPVQHMLGNGGTHAMFYQTASSSNSATSFGYVHRPAVQQVVQHVVHQEPLRQYQPVRTCVNEYVDPCV